MYQLLWSGCVRLSSTMHMSITLATPVFGVSLLGVSSSLFTSVEWAYERPPFWSREIWISMSHNCCLSNGIGYFCVRCLGDPHLKHPSVVLWIWLGFFQLSLPNHWRFMCSAWVAMDGMFEILLNTVDAVDSIYFFGARVWSRVAGSEPWEPRPVCLGLRIATHLPVEVWLLHLPFLIICFVKNSRN